MIVFRLKLSIFAADVSAEINSRNLSTVLCARKFPLFGNIFILLCFVNETVISQLKLNWIKMIMIESVHHRIYLQQPQFTRAREVKLGFSLKSKMDKKYRRQSRDLDMHFIRRVLAQEWWRYDDEPTLPSLQHISKYICQTIVSFHALTLETRSLKTFFLSVCRSTRQPLKESGLCLLWGFSGINSCILSVETNFWRETIYRSEWSERQLARSSDLSRFCRSHSKLFLKIFPAQFSHKNNVVCGKFSFLQFSVFPFLRLQHCIGLTAHKTNPFEKGLCKHDFTNHSPSVQHPPRFT